MASTTLLPYAYLPLSDNAQTRVIELQPFTASDDDDDDPPGCLLRDFDVLGDEEYEAISYTWGEPVLTERLIVDDTYFLMTTVNCRDVLLRFRLPDRVRLLWVDAVCINQQDEDEKGRQIPFMAQIYSGASRVHQVNWPAVDRSFALLGPRLASPSNTQTNNHDWS
ncbi:HET-domain-containing protein [Apiospora sp. TS-2023a]